MADPDSLAAPVEDAQAFGADTLPDSGTVDTHGADTPPDPGADAHGADPATANPTGARTVANDAGGGSAIAVVGDPANSNIPPSMPAQPPTGRDSPADPATAPGNATGGHQQPPPSAAPQPDPFEAKFVEQLLDLLEKKEAATTPTKRRFWSWLPNPFAPFLRLLRLSSSAGWIGDVLASPPAIARLIILSRKLSEASAPGYFREAYFATLLYRQLGQDASCDAVLSDIEYAVSRSSPIRTVMHGVKRIFFTAVILFCLASLLGLGAEYYRTGSLATLLTTEYFPVVSHPLFISAVMGLLGSIVSIVLRLADFEGPTRKSENFLFMTGFTLPIVGASFALVTGAMLAAGVVNINIGTANLSSSPNFFVVLGFLSGFSERFTRSMLAKVENAVESDTKQQDGTGSETKAAVSR